MSLLRSHSSLRILLEGLTASVLASVGLAQTFDFEGTARAYVQELGATEATFDEFLDSRHFLEVPLGTLDIRIPCAAVQGKEAVDELREVADIALRLEEAWAIWRATDAAERKQLASDVKSLRKWVKTWSTRALEKAAREGGPLLERLGADEKTAEAARRLRNALVPHTVGQEGVHAARPARVVVAPDRRTYVQLVSAIGLLEPDSRQRVWTDNHLFTPNAWSLAAQVIPLRHPAYPYDAATAFQGWKVERYLTSSFEQHVAQRLAASHLRNEFFWATDALLETALRTNLEIACLGEIKLTNDFSSFVWSRAGGSTEPYSRFVPGGNSAGGTLPARKATAGPLQSQGKTEVYIEEIGHSFFLKSLRERQKAGAKLAGRAKDIEPAIRRLKEPHFALSADKEKHRVQAPFLGENAGAEFPPLTFLDDYEDFFSAYRSSFFEWLRTESMDHSEERFSRLLVRMGEGREGDTLATACREVFEMPLGFDAEVEETLEGGFLEWLSKKR